MTDLAFRAAERLRASDSASIRVLAGFDGFIDTICDVVDTRRDAGNYERVPTISAYAERLAEAAGKSTNVEVVPTLIKLGGNGPIMANALAAFDVDLTYCGMTGFPQTNPVFSELESRAKLLPLSEPALTDAYEFDDGKLIIGKHATVAEVSWENLIERVGKDTFSQNWNDATFVAMVNWTMLPFMTELWKHLRDEFKASGERKTLFFDLADPEKREREDIVEALETLASFQSSHDVILGVNEKEAIAVGEALDVPTPIGEVLTHESAQELADALRSRLEVNCVVVHPTRFAAGAKNGQTAVVDGPWTPKPKISTGAGDHFNAGFCLGQMIGADLEASLQIGVGTSGFYVRNAQSPSREELADFVESL